MSSDQPDQENSATMSYFPRHLRITNGHETERIIDETELLAIAGSKIVLGEPGMGKSELINELARRLRTKAVTATRFMRSKNPLGLVICGKPLLIDGLDEAIARNEGDAIDTVFAQLEAAGCPEFILSCRTREWQSRGTSLVQEIYEEGPVILELEVFGRREAHAFLFQQYGNTVNPEQVLSHLDEHGITELYSNPLTLGLLGTVAERDIQLPATRSALFERVCALIWPEHDPDRQESGLGKINESTALAAAGALMAGMLLAGADAISLSGPVQLQDGDVRLVDLEILPDAGSASAVFSSKLFRSVGLGRAIPIHRVIAEFLGSRWLAQKATAPRARRRLLAQLHGNGEVPASLRGLHAWLAFHSSAMSKDVIHADPFGVLRYGDPANLTAEQAGWMFDALQSLAQIDPYFRAQDWNSRTATGLMIPSLRDKIEEAIASTTSNFHLRSLLITALKSTLLAGDLAETIERVMCSTERSFAEREDAVDALLPFRDRQWWQQAIIDLHAQCTDDSVRLALNIIGKIDCGVTDDLLVAIVLADMGLSMCSFPRAENRRGYKYRHYERIAGQLPTERIFNVLNLMASYPRLSRNSDPMDRHAFGDFASLLMARAIDEGIVGLDNAGSMWNWLGAAQSGDGHKTPNKELLQTRLDANDSLRRAIQEFALYQVRPYSTILVSEAELRKRLIGLGQHPNDVIWFLGRLSATENGDTALRQDWRDLIKLGYGSSSLDSELLSVGRQFINGDQQLEHFIHKLDNPKQPAWERKHARAEAKRSRKACVETEFRRRLYIKTCDRLRAGDLNAILDPAKCYLGLFSESSPNAGTSRLSDWLDPTIETDVLAGLESVLHRSDLPSPTEVASGFAANQIWNYCFPILAGLMVRQRAGSSYSDLSVDVLTTGLLICHDSHSMCADDDISALRDELEKSIIPSDKEKADFARLWIEPFLIARRSHVAGLRMLSREKRWHSAGTKLASEWLSTFSDLPYQIEMELVDCLTHGGDLTALATIATLRAQTVFQDEERRLAWLAIDVLTRFDAVLSSLKGIGATNPEFVWYLRNRFQFERHGATLRTTIQQAKWIVSEFRTQWPYATLEGISSGDTNPYDATDFLRALINRIADDTSSVAINALQELIAAPNDSYSELIRHMAAEQRQKRAEEYFTALSPKELNDLLNEGPPSNVDDLKSLVLEELAVAQKVLIGDDVDQVRDFWSDSGVPYGENRCRDRLAALIGPNLVQYDIHRITEADMPMSKRADLAFSCGQIQLPMEVKGQWHSQVWMAATDQLARKYLVDWRSEQRGIYCVLWFGDLPSASGRRLQPPPGNLEAPKSAKEMREMLIVRIPEAQRLLIDVVVIDFTAGRH